jgi:hypothetical protein
MSEYSGEWNPDQWKKAWSIHVGKAYACKTCGSMIMVTKGGTGVLQPICCGKPMREIVQPDKELK